MYFVSRKESFARFFFVFSFIGLVTYILLAVYTFNLASLMSSRDFKGEKLKGLPAPEIEKPRDQNEVLKYILIWTTPGVDFKFDHDGQKVFEENECDFKNCYITADKTLLQNDVKNFDAIIFSIRTLVKWKKNMPTERSLKQKYIFYSMAPANERPICDIHADNFFNWTWTYKLYSDISTPFIEVKTLKGIKIAPNIEVDWDHDVLCLYNDTQQKKHKAMMWYTENCRSVNANFFAKKLQSHMTEHGIAFDIFGCVNKCPAEGCLKPLESNYSFHFVVEDSISDDYLTKKVLKAYNNNAIPVIMSGADYTKFLPPGSYIDARLESPEGLAGLIKYIIANPSIYSKYFSWKHYYTITEARTQKGYCELCDLLNDKERMNAHDYYERFRKWWYYGNLKTKCIQKDSESIDDLLSYEENADVRKKQMLLP